MFYGRHPDLVDHYGISVSQMTTICSTCRKHFPVLSLFVTFWLSNLSILSVPDDDYYVPDDGYYVSDDGYYLSDEGYSKNASCALNLISTFFYLLSSGL